MFQLPNPICEYCGEEVLPGEGPQHILTDLKYKMHAECLFRSVAGSVSHLRKECSCYVTGSSESDPPGMTLREGAKASLEEYRKANPKPGELKGASEELHAVSLTEYVVELRAERDAARQLAKLKTEDLAVTNESAHFHMVECQKLREQAEKDNETINHAAAKLTGQREHVAQLESQVESTRRDLRIAGESAHDHFLESKRLIEQVAALEKALRGMRHALRLISTHTTNGRPSAAADIAAGALAATDEVKLE